MSHIYMEPDTPPKMVAWHRERSQEWARFYHNRDNLLFYRTRDRNWFDDLIASRLPRMRRLSQRLIPCNDSVEYLGTPYVPRDGESGKSWAVIVAYRFKKIEGDRWKPLAENQFALWTPPDPIQLYIFRRSVGEWSDL